MRPMTKKIFFYFSAVVLCLMLPQISAACPVCFGTTESNEVKGMEAAITVMLGITGVVLAGISSFFIYMIVRLRRLRNRSLSEASVNEQGDIQWNNF
jgi:ABC-type Fe3+ transport system permease subunit